ncbi:DoxX family protein [Natrialba sp. PRR66]|uniref:DoxX family protein n=1 Tax=Natrialba sp. PRR66 TaxID=3098146 RepID=UPI002B1E86BE|nr:DoxX family protein [Natrialba sp. PRR66]
MTLQSWFQSSGDGDGEAPAEPVEPEPSAETSWVFRLGRALFGGILAFNALDNLWNLDERIAYAEAKNTPMPEYTVPATSGGLLLGGIGIALWRRPSAAAALIAGFLVSVTPVMHDFWNLDDPEEKQQQLIHFLKNTALFGAALAFLRFGRRNGSSS